MQDILSQQTLRIVTDTFMKYEAFSLKKLMLVVSRKKYTRWGSLTQMPGYHLSLETKIPENQVFLK